MWKTVTAWRQTRKDYMVEVCVNGVWHLACNLEWACSMIMPREPSTLIGQCVRTTEIG